MRFIHAADIHLDSPLRGLETHLPTDRIRVATRQALTNLVELCLSEQVDFLVIAGDIFDADWKDFQTALFVTRELRKLKRANIPVFLIHGNHDSVEGMSKRTPWPDNVHVFAHKQPETKRLEELRVALHGRSFPKREVLENWVPHYPQPVAGWFNIGLLHTNADGSPNHDSYAPCAVTELAAKGYDYWALGHVHDYAILNQHPHVVYSGNLQGRHVRETGPKGCVLVEVEGNEIRSLEFRTTDVLRWSHEIVELQPDDSRDDVLVRVRERLNDVQAQADGRFAVVRLEITGRSRAHQELVRDSARQQAILDIRSLAGEFNDEIGIEKIKFRTQSPLDLEQLRQRHDHIGELLRLIADVARDPAQLRLLGEELKPLATKVAGDLKDSARGDEIDFTDEALLTAWLRDAETLLVNQLVEVGELSA